MFIHITEIKGKYWSENFALCQGVSNCKCNKHAVFDWNAVENSVFTVSFSLSFMC
jgi:hypothetical protein